MTRRPLLRTLPLAAALLAGCAPVPVPTVAPPLAGAGGVIYRDLSGSLPPLGSGSMDTRPYWPRTGVSLRQALDEIKPNALWQIRTGAGVDLDQPVHWEKALGLQDVLAQIQLSAHGVLVFGHEASRSITVEAVRQPASGRPAAAAQPAREAVPVRAEPVPNQATTPTRFIVTRGSLNANLERLVGALGWTKYAPHYRGDRAIPRNVQLDLQPAPTPVSPEYLQGVVHAVMKLAGGAPLKPRFHVPDRVLVLTEATQP